ncbi:MAG: 16S rRNA (guanine(527)-N(7))-methyltransferase RsmG [Fuerstiella sp.]
MLPPTEEAIAELTAEIQKNSLDIDDVYVSQLCDYCRVLWKWNAKINLTRHTDVEAFAGRDLLDTIKLREHLPEHASVLDVGSGGGVPGIPLSILRPDLSITLAESVGKKAKTLRAIVKSLNLPIEVFPRRAEDVLKTSQFDFLTVRAVAGLRKLLFWFQQQSGQFEQMLLIKGPNWTKERDEAADEGLMNGVKLQVIDQYRPPGHDSDSVVLALQWEPKTAEEEQGN